MEVVTLSLPTVGSYKQKLLIAWKPHLRYIKVPIYQDVIQRMIPGLFSLSPTLIYFIYIYHYIDNAMSKIYHNECQVAKSF